LAEKNRGNFMALKFHLLGDSLDARYAAGFRGHAVAGGTDADAPLTASATPGVWAGSVISLVARKALVFAGERNWTPGTDAFTVLMRILPTWTGAPARFQELLNNGFGSATGVDGAFLGYNSSDNPYAVCKTKAGAAIVVGDLGGVLPFISGTPIDIWFIQKSGSGAGKFEVWYANHGNAPTRVTNAAVINPATARTLFLAGRIAFGVENGLYSDYSIVEAAVWDTAEDPTAYGVRAAAITSTVFEGAANTDPGEAFVFDGTAYMIDGVAKSGTFAPAINTIAQQGLFSVPGLSVYKTGVVLTQGDDVLVQLKAMADKTSAFDLTNASLESYVKGTGGISTISNSDHTVDPDQSLSGNRGIFTVRVRAAVSSVLNVANQKDWVTQITQGQTVRHVHGVDLVTVRSATPLD
jgi:hypothetical protein